MPWRQVLLGPIGSSHFRLVLEDDDVPLVDVVVALVRGWKMEASLVVGGGGLVAVAAGALTGRTGSSSSDSSFVLLTRLELGPETSVRFIAVVERRRTASALLSARPPPLLLLKALRALERLAPRGSHTFVAVLIPRDDVCLSRARTA